MVYFLHIVNTRIACDQMSYVVWLTDLLVSRIKFSSSVKQLMLLML